MDNQTNESTGKASHSRSSEASSLSDVSETTHLEWRTAPRKLYITYVTIIGAIGGLLFGYDTGVISGALLQINSYFRLSDFEKEAVVSITVLVAILGASTAGSISNKIGRKLVVLVASAIFVGGAILMAVADSLVVLLAGRAIVGLAIGQASMIVPMYIAEMAPAEYRGRLVTVNALFITGGQFVASLVDGAFSGTNEGWRWMLGIGGLPAALQFLGLFGLPESPRYLVAAGKIDKARNALIKLRGTPEVVDRRSTPYGTCDTDLADDLNDPKQSSFEEGEVIVSCENENEPPQPVASLEEEESKKRKARPVSKDPIEKEIADIERAIEEETKGGQALLATELGQSDESVPHHSRCWNLHAWAKATKQMFSTKAVRRALIVGCMLQFLQQAAGINTVMYYSGTILHNAGFDDQTAIWLTAVVAFTNFLFSSLGLHFVESAGRRKLTLLSVTGVTIALFFLGSVFLVKRQDAATTISSEQGGEDSCNRFSNCLDCAIHDKCGFLGNSSVGYCLRGDQDGPDNFDMNKAPPTFKWGYSQCFGSLQHDLGWAALAALMFYLMCFAPGLASMPWTVNSEIYPTKVRAVAVSIATTVNWIFNLIVSMTFISLANAITPFGSFALYAGVALLGGIFLYFRLPETKGRSLEEIQALLEK